MRTKCDPGEAIGPAVANESLDHRGLGVRVERDDRGKMVGGAGRDVDDLDEPGRGMVAAEPEGPALATDELGQGVVAGLGVHGTDRQRPEMACRAVEPAVDEQQPRPVTFEPGKLKKLRAGRVFARLGQHRERRQVAPAPGLVAVGRKLQHAHAAISP